MMIYPKDVQLITGRSERHARKLLCRIRAQAGKEKHLPVTVQEFAQFMKLKEEDVWPYIQ